MYGIHYKISYYRKSDIQTDIYILEKDYVESVIEELTVRFDGGLDIPFDGDINNIFQPTVGSGATINIMATPLTLLNLYTDDPQKFMVKVYNSNTVFVTSGNNWYSKGIRNGYYAIDYSADGGLTWELDAVVINLDEDSIVIAIDAGITGYRQQIRGTALKIDHVLTPTGFAGTEDIDWENIYTT